MSKNRLIPKLRFPEFVNDGEWEVVSIKTIGEVITGNTPSKKQANLWEGDFVWVTAQDFSGKYIYNSVLKLTDKGKKKSRIIPKNSILVTCIASIGLNGINKVECATNQQINSIICTTSNNYEFVYYAIKKNTNRLKRLAGQTAVPIINKSTFEKFTIQKPKEQNTKEQQKIASCLSSLDEVIEAHSKKLQLLKDHKKGLMQNLFPQEGEKVPKLRFPEFQNCGEWEEATLGDISEITTGASNRENSTLDKGKYAFFDRSEDIRTSDRFLFEGEAIIVAGEGQKFIPKYFWGKFDLHQRAYAIMNFTINGKFAFYFILKNNSYFIQYAVGSTVKSLRQPIFEQMPIFFPKNKQEQQKIAFCLSSLDEVIEAHSKKLQLLKDHKKGLMQNLFPQEGEKVPKLRFPEFQNCGEWEEKKLDEVCKVNPLNKNLPDKFVYIDLESVKSRKLLKKNIINRDGAPSRAQRLLKNEDIIFQMVRPYQKNNYFFKSDDNLEYVASTGYAQLRTSENKMFLFQYIHNDNFVNRVLEKCTGSNYPAINSSDLSKIQIVIPKNSKEQQKIASCLSALDELITSQTEKIEQLQQHKKGLMQGLFPKMDS